MQPDRMLLHDTSSKRGSMMPRRLVQLYAGLVLFGVSMALLVRARLGLDSWDVLHQGLATQTGLRFGWIVVGLAVDAALDVMPAPGHIAARWAFLAAGILVNGVATGLYIGAGLGPG